MMKNTQIDSHITYSSIHFSSVSRIKKEKEDLRALARSYLASCLLYGKPNHDISFLNSFLQFKGNDWAKALSVANSLPDVGKTDYLCLPHYYLSCDNYH